MNSTYEGLHYVLDLYDLPLPAKVQIVGKYNEFILFKAPMQAVNRGLS